MTAVVEKAYAKINLYLDILGIRGDGFHEIKTVMHTVSLCDDIYIELTSARTSAVKMICEGNPYLPQDSRNIAVRAAELFLDKLGKPASVLIKIKKRIPVAAGLAGGSSDAAAVLRGMNKIFKRPFTKSALCAMAAELGSDVPYCVMGKTALCTGRGEKLDYIYREPWLHLVIAIANEFVSTPEAYSALDSYYSGFVAENASGGLEKYDIIANGLSKGELDTGGLFNAFEPAILPRCPGASAIKAQFLRLGAVGALMSGSGPSVFGIFESAEAAQSAEAALSDLGYRAFAAHSVV